LSLHVAEYTGNRLGQSVIRSGTERVTVDE
jgi:hypothetical protein